MAMLRVSFPATALFGEGVFWRGECGVFWPSGVFEFPFALSGLGVCVRCLVSSKGDGDSRVLDLSLDGNFVEVVLLEVALHLQGV